MGYRKKYRLYPSQTPTALHSHRSRLYLKNVNSEYQRNIIAGSECTASNLLFRCPRLHHVPENETATGDTGNDAFIGIGIIEGLGHRSGGQCVGKFMKGTSQSKTTRTITTVIIRILENTMTDKNATKRFDDICIEIYEEIMRQNPNIGVPGQVVVDIEFSTSQRDCAFYYLLNSKYICCYNREGTEKSVSGLCSVEMAGKNHYQEICKEREKMNLQRRQTITAERALYVSCIAIAIALLSLTLSAVSVYRYNSMSVLTLPGIDTIAPLHPMVSKENHPTDISEPPRENETFQHVLQPECPSD